MIRFNFSYCDDSECSGMVHAFCKDAKEASKVKAVLRSLGGSMIEQDDNFLYCIFSADRGPEAVEELEEAGYKVDTSEVEF